MFWHFKFVRLYYPPPPWEDSRVNIDFSKSTGIANLGLNNVFDLRSFKRIFTRGYPTKAFWKSAVQLYSQPVVPVLASRDAV